MEYFKQLSFVPPDTSARLAQSVEHETLNLRVVGSSPTLGAKSFGSPHGRGRFITSDQQQWTLSCGAMA